VADGAATATLTATLRNASNAPMVGVEVSLTVNPNQGVAINGAPVPAGPVSLGLTDDQGIVTAQISATKAGLKTLTVRDETEGVTLTLRPTITFLPGPPDAARSVVTAIDRVVAADGLAQSLVLVTVSDAFGNRVAGATVELLASGHAVPIQPTSPTDTLGQARGYVTDATVETVIVRATADGVLIDDSDTIAFRGADLALTKTGQALSNYDGPSTEYALAGGTITYRLSVRNEGVLPATDVELVDTLPANISFVQNLSGPAPQVAGQVITYDLGTLAVGETQSVEFEASIAEGIFGQRTNAGLASTSGEKDDLSDNDALLATTVELSRPVITLSPIGPTLDVEQAQSAQLAATVRNRGAGEMTGISVSPPPHIPWVTVDASGLTTLAPRTDGTFTLTASPPAGTIPGSYRDFVEVRDDYGNLQRMALTVRVFAPRRALTLTVENDQGQSVADAQVQLIRQQASVVVTEGVTQTYNETLNGRTNASGLLSLQAVQLGAYDLTVVAPDHDTALGVLTMVAGDGAQEETVTLHARGRLGLTPTTARFGVLRGTVAGVSLTLTNLGQAPLTDLSIEPPAGIPWVTIAAPDPLPDLAPGASLSFDVLASPATDQAGDIFQDFVTVRADGGLSAQVALTIELTSDVTRDLRLNVVDDFDEPVAGGGEIVLIEQEPTEVQLPGGETRTFNQHYTLPLLSGGTALFPALDPGAYNYIASPNGYTRQTGEILVQPGAGVQEAIVRSKFDPFTYAWTVVPLDVGYEITLTMTYDVTTPMPRLEIPEVCWNPGDSPTSQAVYLFNPSALPMALEGVRINLPGAQTTLGTLAAEIPPDSLVTLPVEVVKTGALTPGTIEVDYAWQRALDEYVTFTFNPSSKTSPLIPPGFVFDTTYGIEPAVFDPGVTYTTTITPPTELTWITLTSNSPNPMLWTEATEIKVALHAEPPTFLAPGVYTDRATIRVDGSDGTWREGYLELEATRTSNGLFLHTTFTLGPVPTEARQATAGGVIRAGNCTSWIWSSAPGSHRLVGTTAGSSASFPTFAGAPTYNFDHQQVRLEMSQKVMLEGEAFQARLEITNTSAAPIEDVSVKVLLTDLGGDPRSSFFAFDPATPTALGTIGVGGSTSKEWILLPSLLAVTNPEGEPFLASARITYTWGGQTFFSDTVPERITVYPSPDLVISYQLPLPQNACTDFPLKVTIHNRGQGPARNLRFSTSLPRVVDPVTGITIPFTITQTTLNGVAIGPTLNVTVGDLAPDVENPAVIVWRLHTALPGRFVEFTSDFRQLNPLNVPLRPLISEVRTFFAPGPCGKIPDRAVFCASGECPTRKYEDLIGEEGGPINTRTGGVSFPATDFSFPTAAGPLAFERWYASPTISDYTELLGPGWTHSLDSRLIFPSDPLGEPGVIQLKLHSSNRIDFLEAGDGVYEPYPGVCGDLRLLEDGSGGYVFTDDAQNAYSFDAAGRILSASDPQGNALLYVYDGEGRLDRVSDEAGVRYLAFSYDAQGRIESIEDHTHRHTRYAYDDAGDLTQVTDVLDQAWTYAYDDAHRLTEARDPRDTILERNVYDAEGRAVRQYNGEDELVVALSYNADGTTTITDALGHTETHRYDERGALVEQINAAGGSLEKDYDANFGPTEFTDRAENVTTLEWSDDGANLTQVVDAEGNTTRLAYDELNNLTGLEDPRGGEMAFEYDGTLLVRSEDAQHNATRYTYTDGRDAPAPPGLLKTILDPRGSTTSFGYNASGQRTSMTDTQGHITHFVYDNLGRLVETTDPLSRRSRNEFDALGRLVLTIRNYDPDRSQNEAGVWNITTDYTYDAAGNQTQVTDSLGRVTRYTYDSANRLVTVTDPANNTTRSSYDDAGNLISTRDALGRKTEYHYDSLNRLVRVIDAADGEALTTFDASGNVASQTDVNGNTTRYEHDDLNRQVAVIDALGQRATMSYDASGNLVASADAAGRTTTYGYDSLNRMVTQTDPEGGVTRFEYDAIGNRIRSVDREGSPTVFAYDGLNRLLIVTDALGGVMRFEYDAVGNRTSMTDANRNTTLFFYDELNRLVETHDPLGGIQRSEFDALGNLVAQIDPNEVRTRYEYDSLNRLHLRCRRQPANPDGPQRPCAVHGI
jgi:uncharacterized repeat protein (TIGR01451 family)